MTKEQQDLAWACLPKEARDEIRNDYNSHPLAYHPYFNEGYGEALKIYFGKHNLTSDTEPEEMLIVERKKVVEWYSKLCDTIEKRGDGEDYHDGYYRGQIDTLQSLFGDKCLPDSPIPSDSTELKSPSVQVEPKFKVGDKVYQTSGHNRLDEYTVKKVYKDKQRGIVYDIQGLIGIMGIEEHNLCLTCQNPYTEPESRNLSQETANCDKPEDNQLKDNMEEKELKKPLPPPRPKTNHQEFVDRANIIHNNKYKYPDEYAGSNKKLRIICPIHGEFWQTPNSHLKGHGCWKCASQRNTHLICGVGENDAVFAKETKIRNIWYQMLNRCYNESVRSKYPTYEDCSVHEDWHKFSNFLKWYKSNNPHGFELDKDILYKGNKIYGPDTCCCLPKSINVLIRPMEKRNSVIPTKDGKYRVVCKITDGFKKFRGVFNSFEEALSVAKHIRRAKIAELAILYFNQGKINKQVFIALLNYDFN